MLRPKHCALTVLFIVIVIAGFPPFAGEAGQTRQVSAPTCAANRNLPDPVCTPGSVLTRELRLICKSGYTKTVRDVPQAVKKQVFAAYRIPWEMRSSYQLDHLIALELGGANDAANLWPEALSIEDGAKDKDRFENYLHAQVCAGKMSLEEAQRKIATDWFAHYAAAMKPSKPSASSTRERTPSPALPAKADPAVKKSSTGICHIKGSSYYGQTEKFTPYESLQACVASGGRTPK